MKENEFDKYLEEKLKDPEFRKIYEFEKDRIKSEYKIHSKK
jgi:hypothetical protein